ncbi:General alpha-glucoside permease [Fulvia fulva]|uniref:General alpha-glucoside permease n=1 Tax=Passalora fulva TaxID=5499 RepID=A0A9Q8UVT0_PASFU|nr:General alpha-glucoside permease [Fulvia fulva]KAK4610084.1 General alpha-glucoside permease [Fulvia fulva]KAK4611439.1 General alpha-glucoside permease [Fulvia fulva]UJO24309.1 General alpha-glucoside permease [Fulvia fulva]WPV21853.1 General alpha-glucoside permease [Fulvia fulva]WPV36899.1 General alpha-glucoside permease [Fulvia fulva]
MTSTFDHNYDRNDELLDQNTDSAPLLSHQSQPPTSSKNTTLSLPQILALVCINGGLQVFFSTVMANLSPYLHNLGLSKSAAAIIIICLPLSGAFLGPTAGAFSDSLRTRFGRRRPIILSGAVLTVAFMMLLAWVPQFIEAEAASLALAILCTILMAISVQPVQAGVRALMVDIAPASQQSRASSWAGRIQGVSAIFSFFASSLTLPSLPGLGGLAQMQALACLNFITLGSTVAITCVFIHEKDSRRISVAGEAKRSVADVFRRIFSTVKELKGKIRQTCLTQFFSWFAWFPFTYYNTTYIGELGSASMSTPSSLLTTPTSSSSLAPLSFATISFITITLLPTLLPHASRYLNKPHTSTSDSDLIWLWTCTQPILGLLLALTLAVSYQYQGIILVAFAGIPWAVTQWVPFAIVGYETSRLGLVPSAEREDGEDGQRGRDDEEEDSRSGATLGVHNLAISLPQVLSGLVSSGTYKIAEVAKSEVPTAWVLASSGVAAFVASWLAAKMLR